ncbi:MAG: protein translocase subunit SecF [Proteobacteria bacterium]|nr:protein translocase subunit SecF [Pseudomonadota bacterium]
MLNITATDAIGMVVAAVSLIALALWAAGFRNRTRDLVGSRNIFFGISAVLLVISFGAISIKKFNYGMDFAGGTLVEIGVTENQESVTPELVRNAIQAYATEKSLSFQDPQVQVEEKSLNSKNPYRRVIIRVGRIDQKPLTTAEIEGMATAIEGKVGHLFRQAGKSIDEPAASASGAPAASASGAPAASASGAPAASASGVPAASASGAPEASASPAAAPPAESTAVSAAILSRETIDPIIGRELWVNSLLALVVALVLQLIYITLRFGNQVRYGLAADIALVHDVIIMAGLYSLTSRQVDSPFLAALLTVIGYSVMDSIVVFDRIRENVKNMRKGNYAEICNLSVNQTMSRSVNTTLTVLLTLFALYFFGGDTLRNFAFALLVGITSGAYSSIFIATPLVVILDEWAKKREEERVAERRRERGETATSNATLPVDNQQPRRRASDSAGAADEEEEAVEGGRRPDGTRRRNKSRRRGL